MLPALPVPAGYTQVKVGGSVVSNIDTEGIWVTTGNPFFWGSGATPSASATYTNWPTVNPKSICLACHLPSGGFSITGFGGQTVNAPDYFTPWSYTVHASFFMRNINAISDTSQISSCVVCHTLGYDVVYSGLRVAKQLRVQLLCSAVRMDAACGEYYFCCLELESNEHQLCIR